MECRSVRCAKGRQVWITCVRSAAFVGIYAFTTALCGASLIKTPNNTAVVAGQRMEMQCRPDNSSTIRKWVFFPLGSDSSRPIASIDNRNIVIAPNVFGFGIDVDDDGSVILYSNSTESKDAGIYTCQGETGSTEFKYSAQLIVLESQPICETNLNANTSWSNGDYIWMKCRVNFRGNWTPSMEWRKHPSNGDDIEVRLVSNETNTTTVKVNESFAISSTLVVIIVSANYNSYYSCRTYFTSQSGRLRANATNLPDFNYNWNTNLIVELKTSTATYMYDTSTTTPLSIDVIYMFAALCAAVFLIMMVTAAVCCVVIRRKTAAWMAKVVSTYENRERPQSVRSSRRFSTLNFRLHRKTLSRDDVHRPEREPSEGYTSVDDLTEECHQAAAMRPTTSGTPKYSAVFKKQQGAEVTPRVRYSLAKEDVLEYATLRKNIEPPKYESDDDIQDSDSESEDLK